MTNPIKHAETYEDTLWSVTEIQLFLEHYLLTPKEFGIIGQNLPHKEISQLIQFYYDFRDLFCLKRSVLYITARRKGKKVNHFNLIKDVFFLNFIMK